MSILASEGYRFPLKIAREHDTAFLSGLETRKRKEGREIPVDLRTASLRSSTL